MKQLRIYIVAGILLTLSACTTSMRIEDPQLAQACATLWHDAQAADSICRELDRMSLTPYEQHRLALLEAHLSLKICHTIPATTDLHRLADWFSQRDDGASAAEALYIAGAYANWKEDNVEAMRCLKEAEQLHPTGIVAGMTYYKMGRISETEQLYDVAADYYLRGVDYIDEAGLPFYQACIWRELARTRNDSTVTGCYKKALQYAEQTGDSLLCLDIRYALASQQPDNTEAIAISRYLCDSADMHRYAYDLVKHYVRANNPTLAQHYLDILAQDTVSLHWSATQYLLWHSRYDHMNGMDKEAYEELLSLFENLYGRTEQENRTQTYAIAQRYDNEAERAKNLQLQLEKQRLYFILAGVLIVLLLVMIAGIVAYSRRRTRHLLEKTEQEQQIAHLQAELQLRREALRRVLEQRISLTKNMQEELLHQHNEGEVPDWAQDFLQQNIFSTGEQWQAFLEEFNGCYSGLLNRLQERYPKLTATDLQVIALIIIGLDIADICLLLGLTQRTIWSRRLRIRQRLELAEGTDLDDWLRHLSDVC